MLSIEKVVPPEKIFATEKAHYCVVPICASISRLWIRSTCSVRL